MLHANPKTKIHDKVGHNHGHKSPQMQPPGMDQTDRTLADANKKPGRKFSQAALKFYPPEAEPGR